MKDLFGIFDTSEAKDTNKKHTTNKNNTNQQQHNKNKINNNKNKSNKQRHTTKSILQNFPPTNVTKITPKQSPLQLPVTVNQSVSLLPSRSQQILQQSSIIRPPTNTSTLI